MARREEFKVTIDKDGRIHLDFRGMEESSYRRILEALQESVGPVEAADTQFDEADPPGVLELRKAQTEAQAELKNRQTEG